MFSQEEIDEVMKQEEVERQIALEEAMLADEETLYENLPNEAWEAYCVPRWYRRKIYVD